MKNWEEIDGWFDYQRQAYDFAIKLTPSGGKIAELGAWKGRSTSYLCDRAVMRGIEVHVIDTWKGSPNELDSTMKEATEKDIYETYKANMGERPRIDIRKEADDAVKYFDDGFFDVVIIDLTHTYEEVKKDIGLWLPKVKHHGLLIGDDYGGGAWPGVAEAVDEVLPERTIINRCWVYHVR